MTLLSTVTQGCRVELHADGVHLLRLKKKKLDVFLSKCKTLPLRGTYVYPGGLIRQAELLYLVMPIKLRQVNPAATN